MGEGTGFFDERILPDLTYTWPNAQITLARETSHAPVSIGHQADWDGCFVL